MLRCYPDPLVDESALRAIRCTVRKAIRRGWFSKDDFEDLVQDIVVQLLNKLDCFDPCRASWATFCSLVAKSTLSRIRRCQRNKTNVESLDDQPEGEATGCGAGQIEERHCVGKRFQRLRSQFEWLELEDDVSLLLELLPESLREICELLCEDSSMSSVASQLGVSRNTIYRRKRLVRESIKLKYMAEYC